MVVIGIILLSLSFLMWFFSPYVEEIDEDIIVWWSTPFDRTNRKYIRL